MLFICESVHVKFIYLYLEIQVIIHLYVIEIFIPSSRITIIVVLGKWIWILVHRR